MDIEKKYVMLDERTPILFPAYLEHREFKNIGNITSAGFVSIYIENGKLIVDSYGKSDTLGLEAKKEDGPTIERFLKPDW